MLSQRDHEVPGGQESRWGRRQILLAVLGLLLLVWAVFLPVLWFEFITLDVPKQIVNNPYVRGLTPANLAHIFSSRCVTSYYPVRTLTYAIDYQLWELNPMGFKLTNCLLHSSSVLLVFWLILRLFDYPVATAAKGKHWRDVALAAFAAGAFAVHPVVVEPVAWVPGREELLTTLGALGCLHFYLTARRMELSGARRRVVVVCYAAAAFCCAGACLSNAVAAVIPLIVTAWDLLTLPRPRLGRIVRSTSTLWAIGIAAVLIKRWGYAQHSALQEAAEVSALLNRMGYVGGRSIGEVGMFSPQRLMLVLNVYWLNLKTLAWPTDLAISYDPLLPQTFLEAGVILGGLAALATCGLLWAVRRRTLLLFGLLWFVLALGPTAQIIPHHLHRGDRFLYLPLVGLAIALAVGLRPVVRSLNRPGTVAIWLAASVAALIALDRMSTAQVPIWRNDLAVWENCVRVAPNNHVAHRILADKLAQAGEHDRAFAHYQAALRMNVHNIEGLTHFARYLALADDLSMRDYDLAIRLATSACQLSEWQNPKPIRVLAIAHNNFGEDLRQRGRFDEAIQQYRKAIDRDGQYASPMLNLALLLATCPDSQWRDAQEAAALAERACRVGPAPDANALMILAIAHAQAGKPEEAVQATERAIRAARAAGDASRAESLRQRLELYRRQIRANGSGR